MLRDLLCLNDLFRSYTSMPFPNNIMILRSVCYINITVPFSFSTLSRSICTYRYQNKLNLFVHLTKSNIILVSFQIVCYLHLGNHVLKRYFKQPKLRDKDALSERENCIIMFLLLHTRRLLLSWFLIGTILAFVREKGEKKICRKTEIVCYSWLILSWCQEYVG